MKAFHPLFLFAIFDDTRHEWNQRLIELNEECSRFCFYFFFQYNTKTNYMLISTVSSSVAFYSVQNQSLLSHQSKQTQSENILNIQKVSSASTFYYFWWLTKFRDMKLNKFYIASLLPVCGVLSNAIMNSNFQNAQNAVDETRKISRKIYTVNIFKLHNICTNNEN